MSQEQHYEWYEYTIDAISVLVLSAVLIIITCLHSKHAIDDLWSTERKCLAHRAHKPEPTRNYKAIVYTTLIAIYSMTSTLIFTAIQYNFSQTKCTIAFAVCEKISFFTSRGALYVLYILRLHYTYGTSGYGWSPKWLYLFGIVTVMAAVALFLYTTLNIVWYPVYIYDTNAAAFPYYCQIVPEAPMLQYAGFGILLFDFVCSIASIVAYVIPLNKIKEDMKRTNPTTYTEKAKKMQAIGTQYKVLVIVGSTTTLVWIALLFAGQMFWATFAINLDFLFNSAVICLMSSYYPHDRYYERLCFICICLCGEPGKRPRKLYHSGATRRNLQLDVSSDTSSMFDHDRLERLLTQRDDDEMRQLNANADSDRKFQ